MGESSTASSAKDKQTLIEDGTQFEGTIVSSCHILVKGQVQGKLDAPSLTVANTGVVRGKVRVTDLVSSGEIEGELEADSMQLSGRVQDNTVIRAKNLDVKLSTENTNMQVVFGSVKLTVGDDPEQCGSAEGNEEAPESQ